MRAAGRCSCGRGRLGATSPRVLMQLASSSIFDSHARRDAPLPAQNEFKCLVDAPGLNKEDLGIEVDGDVLRVRCAHTTDSPFFAFASLRS